MMTADAGFIEDVKTSESVGRLYICMSYFPWDALYINYNVITNVI